MAEKAKKQAANEKEKKAPFWKSIVPFFKGVKAEFGKIIWPTKDELWKQTAAVVIISLVMGVFIKVWDVIVQFGVGFLK